LRTTTWRRRAMRAKALRAADGHDGARGAIVLVLFGMTCQAAKFTFSGVGVTKQQENLYMGIEQPQICAEDKLPKNTSS
jgi:hypothetical protein